MPELKNTRFGTIEFSEDDIVTFSDGLIGFGACRRFVIVNASKGTFRWLQSVEEPALAFLVVDPAEYVDGYTVELGDSEAKELEIGPDTPTLLFTTASIPPSRPEEMSLNLAGPIVINAELRTGRQLIVDDEAVPARHRVFDAPAKAA